MAKRICNFNEKERKAIHSLCDIVRELDQKLDYIIEGQRELRYYGYTGY